MRSDGRSGFLFVTWHQPHIPLPEYPGAQFSLNLEGETLIFPRGGLTIPAGTIARWPFNLEVAGVRLCWATASAFTLLDPDGAPTLVLAAEQGIVPQLCLPEGTVLDGPATALDGNVYAIDAAHPVTLTASLPEGSVAILVLPSHLTDQAWALETPHGRQLVLSPDPLWVGADGRLAGRSRGAAAVRRYSTAAGRFEDVRTGSLKPEPLRWTLPAERIRAAKPVPASFGSLAGRAAAPTGSSIDELAAVYAVDLGAEVLSGEHTELEVAWAGDVARLVVDGTVVGDRFWDGSPWIIETNDAGIRPGSDVRLQILPLAKDAQVGLPAGAQRRRDTVAGDLVSLDRLDVLQWTGWTEDPA
jgi:beta-galactosidase